MYKNQSLESTGAFDDFLRSNLNLRPTKVKVSSANLLSLNGQAVAFADDRNRDTHKTPRSSKESSTPNSTVSQVATSLSSIPSVKMNGGGEGGHERKARSFRKESPSVRASQQNCVNKSIDPIPMDGAETPLVHSWRRHIPQQDRKPMGNFPSTRDRYTNIIPQSVNTSEDLIRDNHPDHILARVFLLWKDGFKERAASREEAMGCVIILRRNCLLSSSLHIWVDFSKAVKFEQVSTYRSRSSRSSRSSGSNSSSCSCSSSSSSSSSSS